MSPRKPLAQALRWICAAGLLGTMNLANADTLNQIYELAVKNDHQIRADEAAYRSAIEAKAIGRANLLPLISATASYSHSDIDTTVGTPLGNAKTDTKVWGATLTQPLINMAAWFGYQQGIELTDKAEADFSAAQQDLIVRTATAYFNVLRAIDTLEASIAEENANSHQLAQTKQRFEVGLTAITDVHEAQASYDIATAQTLTDRGNLGIAFEALEVLTGKPHNTIAPLKEAFPVTKPQPEARGDWVDFAMQNNYTLKSARFASEASRRGAQVSHAAHYPTLSASIGYNDTDSDVADNVLFDRANNGATASLNLSVPIFEGGGTSASSRQAHESANQAQELYYKAQRDTIQQARSLHLLVTTDVARVAARKQAITSSQSAVSATQAGYEVGTRNLVDVLQVQRTLYQARRDYSNALYDYVINQFQLKSVAGNLTPSDVVEINQWLNEAATVDRAKYE
ncbi:TolC family outer membrane protein [Simiduia curdlanivorans]|uniref:TolC family outer membrane protein n=1 Tax=Simiduia curdlanivorans TaxID=1492769 RepID=A0ABV8V1X1_9GAMM|nr:TolC family outer membrane protein [Simiduia curdlanivorans]MDN3637760.1 TolC family outer membrane protein [Simiduia curdlanivorans]